MLPLFDEAPKFDRSELSRRLRSLAADNVWIGTSSWKYEGWFDQIYTRDRYLARGKFSHKRFEQECLAEYAETFPIVCGDFSFYQFPTDQYWKRLFGSAPESLQFVLKVPEEVTVKRWPRHLRYGPRAGVANETFLNNDALETMFLQPLREFQPRVSALIFEFGAFGRQSFETPGDFLASLDRFLARLPADFRFAVEVRNPEYLGSEYFERLRSHGIAHVFNAWTKMPPLSEQARRDDAFTADFFVVRALLRAGRTYEQAVGMFEPYSSIKDENPEARDSLRALIRKAKEERRAAYIFVNNRLEGNAPETIRAVVAGE